MPTNIEYAPQYRIVREGSSKKDNIHVYPRIVMTSMTQSFSSGAGQTQLPVWSQTYFFQDNHSCHKCAAVW